MRRCYVCKTFKEETEFSPNNWTCRPCARAKNKIYRDSHKEDIEEYRKANQPRALQYYKDHAEELREYQRQYRSENAVELAQKREIKKEKRRASAKAWRLANPLKRKANEQKKRALKSKSNGSHTGDEIADLLKRQNHLCANPHCSVDLRNAIPNLDHIVPLSKGGSNSIKNLQWICDPCNKRKYNLDQDVWLNREDRRAKLLLRMEDDQCR